MNTYTPTPPVLPATIESLRAYYTPENFPELVAHSHGWNIYAQSKPAKNGLTYCAAIPTTLDRLPHAYGTLDDVARQIRQGYLRPVTGNLHKAPYSITYTRLGGVITHRFQTLEAAAKIASRIYQEHGIIVGIERGNP